MHWSEIDLNLSRWVDWVDLLENYLMVDDPWSKLDFFFYQSLPERLLWLICWKFVLGWLHGFKIIVKMLRSLSILLNGDYGCEKTHGLIVIGLILSWGSELVNNLEFCLRKFLLMQKAYGLKDIQINHLIVIQTDPY